MPGTLIHARKKTGEFEAQRKAAKIAFLELISEGHAVYHAAKTAGVARNTVYKWRDEDQEFLKNWEEAHINRGDFYEERLRDQSVEGNVTATIVGLKMHKRFIEERFNPALVVQGDLHITAVTNQLTLLMAEADARFPGLLDWYQERVKALGEGQKG